MYETPRVRCVGTVAELTLAQGGVGTDDQWVLVNTVTGATTPYGRPFGSQVS